MKTVERVPEFNTPLVAHIETRGRADRKVWKFEIMTVPPSSV